MLLGLNKPPIVSKSSLNVKVFVHSVVIEGKNARCESRIGRDQKPPSAYLILLKLGIESHRYVVIGVGLKGVLCI